MPEFTAHAFFVCHSSRFTDEATITVTADVAPTEDEVRPLIWAEVSDVIQRRIGEPGYEVEVLKITITPSDG